MRPEEIQALGDLAGEAAAGVAVQIRGMHESIAARVFRAVGPTARPVQLAHEAIAGAAYRGARGLTRALVRAGATTISLAQSPDATPLDSVPAGRLAVGALNGAFGDRLAERESSLALEMGLRRFGREVPVTPAGVRAAYPDATNRIAVFSHGLCETEDAWGFAARRHVPYPYRLHAELGYTPVFVRYNSGRHISWNGWELAELLGRLAALWPARLDEIVLIGHSMGALVARSACHCAPDAAWTGLVRHVFTLGAPHHGAPLERAVNAATAALAALPETRGLAHALNLRSVGIKDLRYGYLTDEDWLEIDCDAFLRRQAREIPFLRHANHYFVCATVSKDADSPMARVIGDLLVLRASAWAHRGGKRMSFPIAHYHHVGAANHFDLLNHPAVYAQIVRWLAPRKALPAPA